MSEAFHGMVGSSPAMRRVYKSIRSVSPLDVPVLILGESGSGKELVARAIHNESPRRSGPFHAVNAGVLTPELVASELFGHEKGAFTGATTAKKGYFESADGGTLFLDEISTMRLETQIDLLRVIETQTFTRVGGTAPISSNVRILAAANVDLRRHIRANTFRPDLYYRLSVFPLALPPLRKRRRDIPVLAEYFRQRFVAEFNRPVVGFDQGALRRLRAYDWPGNVRELSNVIIRLVIAARDQMITEAEVIDALHHTALDPALPTAAAIHEPEQREATGDTLAEPAPAVVDGNDTVGITAGRTITDVERDLIVATLEQTRGNRTSAAKLLGISRKSLYNKIRSYGLE
ncbi:MAG: sigma-54-dependent Fis family transcriptional regulator [Spirochaetaceae bacterium]|nr:MAG: sigma-54-dependent Fis family transcriptional regulator [Spirochaetaceae bacterium]